MQRPTLRSTAELLPQFFLSLVIVLSFAFGAPRALAQVDRAELEGTVTDPSGGVIMGASVKVLAVDTGLSEEQQTNSKGYYRFPGLAVGKYTVTTAGRGFETKAVEDVILRVGQTRTLDVQLGVGGVREKIEVQATMAPTDRVSAEAATVIDQNQISDLPNNGRDWASFTLLAPFAQDDGGDSCWQRLFVEGQQGCFRACPDGPGPRPQRHSLCCRDPKRPHNCHHRRPRTDERRSRRE